MALTIHLPHPADLRARCVAFEHPSTAEHQRDVQYDEDLQDWLDREAR